MKKRVYFESRKIDMRKKVATLITYTFEHPEKKSKLTYF